MKPTVDTFEVLQIVVPTVVAWCGAALLTYRYLDSRVTAQAQQWQRQIDKLQGRVAEAERDLASVQARAITGEHLEKSIDKIEALLTRELSGLREELRQAHSRLDWFMSHPGSTPPRSDL